MKVSSLILLFSSFTYTMAQTIDHQNIKNLEFLIGEWEVTFDWYDTYKPGTEAVFSERGNMVCTYDLSYNGSPKFIFCSSTLYTHNGRLKGRTRETLEMIQWSKFSNCFERTGVYSNWPATGFERFTYNSIERQFRLEGELGVQDGMVERFAEIYQFTEDYTQFERKNVANFSDMPITEFNLTMTCIGRKLN